MKKFLNVLGNIFTVIILVFAITMTVMVITSVRSEDRVPNLFGYALMNVETDSMEAEGGFYVGDMIVVRMIDNDEANRLKVGDVITFRRVQDDQEYLETHRIVANDATVNPEYEARKAEIVDGVYVHGGVSYYMTKGDNTPSVDVNPATAEIEYSHSGTIVGLWEGTRIPKLGAIMKFLQSQMGFMICIVIPIALFFIYELYVFIMTVTRKQKEKALEEVSGKEEELKQKAIAEFLAQQQASGGETAKPETNPAEEKSEEKPAEKTEEKPAEEPKAEPQVTDEEKERIIREYLAKQAAEQKPEDK